MRVDRGGNAIAVEVTETLVGFLAKTGIRAQNGISRSHRMAISGNRKWGNGKPESQFPGLEGAAENGNAYLRRRDTCGLIRLRYGRFLKSPSA